MEVEKIEEVNRNQGPEALLDDVICQVYADYNSSQDFEEKRKMLEQFIKLYSLQQKDQEIYSSAYRAEKEAEKAQKDFEQRQAEFEKKVADSEKEQEKAEKEFKQRQAEFEHKKLDTWIGVGKMVGGIALTGVALLVYNRIESDGVVEHGLVKALVDGLVKKQI